MFRKCQSVESNARDNWRSDFRFGHGDSLSLYQWQGDTIDARTAAGKPCFTVNRTKSYCLQIINDAKSNKAQIEIRAVGGGATYASAEILEGIVRHISYISNAETVFEKAIYDCVFGGIGYWRVTTDYAHDDSFDQEIFIQPIRDALSVYLDPWCQQPDGSDATFGFIFTDWDKDDWAKSHPKFKDAASELPFGSDDMENNWLREDRIRVCEYFRKTSEDDVLHYLDDGSVMRESDAQDDDQLEDMKSRSVDKRDVERPMVEWYLIAGDKIVDHNRWPGKYIPIVPVCATQTWIDGELDRISHVRTLRDPQIAYNWYCSSGIEFVANQTKSPWLADVRAIEGVEDYWRDSNTRNFAVLPYRGIGDDGQPIEPPRRADPPVYAQAFLDGMKISAEEMELVSGQPPSVMGQESNERSGTAVQERQRAAANSTYHFVNALSNAIRFTGKILIDLVPKIYDTPRVMKILAQDGTPTTVQIDPAAQDAHMPVQGLDDESFTPQQVSMVFNPNVGQYDVVAEIGPQFTTRREEFVNATMDLLRENPQLNSIIGDLVFRSMDFPGAMEIADRLRRMVPPQALGGPVDPQVMALQQQLAQQHMLMVQMGNELQQAKSKAESISYQKEIDLYKAESERMKVVGGIDPQALKPIVREMVSQLLGQPINQVIGMHMQEDAAMTQQATVMAQAGTPAQPGQSPPGQPPGPPNGAA